MPARTRKGTKDKPWSEATREKIKASMLINSLENHVLKGSKMKSTQVTAALGLLKKVVPDLSATELSGKVETEQPWIGPKPLTEDDWQAKHGKETEH